MKTPRSGESGKNLPDGIDPGSNVQEVAATDECRVLKLSDETGEGFMTLYRVFDGIYLMYNDFHMTGCTSEYQSAKTLLCLDHCREGRIEHTNGEGRKYYMESGDLRLDKRIHHEGRVHFPLNHYHGITIGFATDCAQEALWREFPFFRPDIGKLTEKFCPADREFLIHGDKQIHAVFEQLYQVPVKVRIPYYKVKIMEILLYLSVLEPRECEEDRPYFFAGQVEKVKAVHAHITEHIDKNYTLEELSEKYDIPVSSMRKCFKGIYGSPIGQYLKKYRINIAASMLKQEKDKRVSDIALDVGYESPAKFAAAFKDMMGQTPLEYRKSLH